MRYLPVFIVVALLAVPAQALDITWHPKELPASALPDGWRYCGGGWMESDDARFGGISGLALDAEGRLLAVSDHGHAMTAMPVFEGGVLRGVTEVRYGDLTDEGGEALIRKQRDAEAVAMVEGVPWVSFERDNRLYPMLPQQDGSWRAADGGFVHPGADALGYNHGSEAIARRGGQWLLLSESAGEAGLLAWIGNPEKGWKNLMYPQSDGFLPTDMAVLPDGRVLVTERRHRLPEGTRTRLMLLPSAVWRGGALEPRLIAETTGFTFRDNIEGIAAQPLGKGEYRILLAVDDNYRLWQYSYLLAFCVKL